MGGMALQDDGSSSVTSSSPLQHFSHISLSPPAAGGGGGGVVAPPWMLRDLKSDERGLYLIHLLLTCSAHVAAGAVDHANACLEHISLLASPDGDTMQRIASIFTDALARRLLRSSLPGLFRAITTTTTSSNFPPAGAAARRHFFDLLPFLKLASVIANQAILEAMEGERVVHVIDLHAADPVPCLHLLQTLAARPEGPPHLRITGIHDRKEILDRVAARLTEEAEKLDVPFQFNAIVSKLESIEPETLGVKTGEAVAVVSVLQLHRLLAPDEFLRKTSPTPFMPVRCSTSGTLGELLQYSPGPDSAVSSSPSPPRAARLEAFLAELWRLSPKIVVVAEPESNHNNGSLTERFTEALHYYAALFDCLESTAAAAEERGRVERELFGEEIRDIIAGEGNERRERHERLERWVRRMEAVGFRRVQLSYYGLLQARRLLQGCYGGGGYRVREEGGGCFLLCWQERPLYSVSAWRCSFD